MGDDAREPVEIEAMQWAINSSVESGKEKAEEIVAWVNANGGEAKYLRRIDASINQALTEARIAVHTCNGWYSAAPGDYIVMGEEWFVTPEQSRSGVGKTRDFYIQSPQAFVIQEEPI